MNQNHKQREIGKIQLVCASLEDQIQKAENLVQSKIDQQEAWKNQDEKVLNELNYELSKHINTAAKYQKEIDLLLKPPSNNGGRASRSGNTEGGTDSVISVSNRRKNFQTKKNLGRTTATVLHSTLRSDPAASDYRESKATPNRGA